MTAPGSRQRGRPISRLGAPRPEEMSALPRSPPRYEVRLDSKLRRPGHSALHSAASAPCRCYHCHHHDRFPRTATWRWRLAASYTPGERSVTSDGDRRGKPGHVPRWLLCFHGHRDFKHFFKSSDLKNLCIFFFFLTHNPKRYYKRQSGGKGTFSKVRAMSRYKTLTRNISVREKFLLLLLH